MTNNVLIRSALISERQALEALQLRASLNNPGDREALLAQPDAIGVPLEQIDAGQVFVAEVAGSLAGFAVILPKEDRTSELDALFVEPRLWRRGIGRKLIDHCAETARTSGASALYVVGNPHAEGFYRACGFKASGTAQTRFGVGLLLRRLL